MFLIDNDPAGIELFCALLPTSRFEVISSVGSPEGRKAIKEAGPCIVLMQVKSKGREGIEALRDVMRINPMAAAIAVVDPGDVESTLEALRHSASDVLNRPVQKEVLEIVVARARERITLNRRLHECVLNLKGRAVEAEERLSRMPNLDTATILIIDDELTTLNTLRMLLRTCGVEVVSATDGEEGLKVFREVGASIVLADMRMPGMNGIELLKEIKRIDPMAEVIAIAGHGEMDVALRALQNSASDFISKPFRADALEIVLARAKERISLKRQLQEFTLSLQEKVAEATVHLAERCRQFELVCQISRQANQAEFLDGLLLLLHDRIKSMTSLRNLKILVLDGIREGFVGGLHRNMSRKFFDFLVGLDGPRTLGPDEINRVSDLLPGRREGEPVMVLPLLGEDGAPAAIALIVPPDGNADEDLHLAHFILYQCSGAIRRTVLHYEQVQSLHRIAQRKAKFGNIVGRHDMMLQVFKLIDDVAPADASVMIRGESGTGKELVARRIHELSPRKFGPFIAVNCSAFPDTLIESELFGFEKGAFTGATHPKKGSFELAHGGTILLDEVAEMSPSAQVKLLRVIQFKEIQRLGSETPTRVDVRIVSATSRRLGEEIRAGRFRDDLYYRLNVIRINLPPLRERMSDLPLLAHSFLRRFNETSEKRVSEVIAPEVMRMFMNHEWPGNVRELENVIEHAFILSKGGGIGIADLPEYLRRKAGVSSGEAVGLVDLERKYVLDVLEKCGGNKNHAAKLLKISRSTLYRKLEQYKFFD